MLEAYCALRRRARHRRDRDHRPRRLRPDDARLRLRVVRGPRARRARGRGALGRPRASRSGSASRSPTSARTRTTSAAGCARHPHDYVIGSVHISAVSPYKADHVAAFVAGRPLAGDRRAVLRRGHRGGAVRPVRHDRAPRLRQALPRAARDARGPRRRPGAVRAGAPRADRDRDGARGQRLRAAPAPARDVPVGGDRGALPRARRATRDHRQRRPPNRVVRISGSRRRIVTRRAPDSTR